jgi:hypothetical protein
MTEQSPFRDSEAIASDDFAETSDTLLPGYGPFREMLSERRELLGRSADRIRADLEARAGLHGDILASLEAERGQLLLQRRHLEKNWGAGYESSVEARKATLDREIAGMARALVQEDLAFWRDSVALHGELEEAESAERLTASAGELGGIVPPPHLSLPPSEDRRAAAPGREPYKEDDGA